MDKIQKNFNLKNQRIDVAISKKDDSIKTSAMMRDAALFTAARLGSWKEVEPKTFIEEHKEWLAYFRKLYFPPDENEKTLRAKEVADPLNHVDVDLPINE